MGDSRKYPYLPAVRNTDFSYFINLTRNLSMLRPLDFDVQPTFYQFPSIIECEHKPDRSMLVLLSCFRGRQKCRQFVLYLRTTKVHKLKLAFSRNTLLSAPSGNPRSETPHALGIPVQRTSPPPMPSEFQFKEPPPMPLEFQSKDPPPCLRNSSSKNPPPPCLWNSSSKNPPPPMPLEFQFKEPPHAFGIPVQRTPPPMPLEFQFKEPPPPPHAFGIPVQRPPPCPRNSSSKSPPPHAFGIPKSRPSVGTDIFWNRPMVICSIVLVRCKRVCSIAIRFQISDRLIKYSVTGYLKILIRGLSSYTQH